MCATASPIPSLTCARPTSWVSSRTAAVVVEGQCPPGPWRALRAGMTVLAWPELPGTTFPDGVTLIDDITQGLRALGLPVG